MTVYLVTHEIHAETSRDRLMQELAVVGDSVRLTDSTYALDTVFGASQLFERLGRQVGRDDSLYIIKMTQPDASYGPREVSEWLAHRLTK